MMFDRVLNTPPAACSNLAVKTQEQCPFHRSRNDDRVSGVIQKQLP